MGYHQCPQCSTFCIHNVVQDMLGKFIIAYINNNLICSPDKETHVSHVKQVLARLLTNQHNVMEEKCEFSASKMAFLGYINGLE